MYVYNTLTRKKDKFTPMHNKRVNIFVCGPTVYDFAHIGHARTYLSFDMIVNYLRYKGYKVFYLQNITDIDDKIIDRAKKNKKNWQELSKYFQEQYLQDMKSLNITAVNKYACATDYIDNIQDQVKRLLAKGFAYKIEDGIYYDVSKFKSYGKLSRRTVEQAEDAVSRIDIADIKKNRGDFCLWKFSKLGEPKWKSEFGFGRPGWHIEDTAITESYFGSQYDIHGGARDLIFPHHEAEIAQMEAISGRIPFVKYWMHTGFLTVNKRKMGKSLGNFITIRKFLENYSAEDLRMFVFASNYKSPLDYSDKAIQQARKNTQKIQAFAKKIKSISSGNSDDVKASCNKQFLKYLDDDFDTPKFFAQVFKFIKQVNKKTKISKKDLNISLGLIKFLDSVFKLIPKNSNRIPKAIADLIQKRNILRKQKKFLEADKIRNQLEQMGYKVQDTDKIKN